MSILKPYIVLLALSMTVMSCASSGDEELEEPLNNVNESNMANGSLNNMGNGNGYNMGGNNFAYNSLNGDDSFDEFGNEGEGLADAEGMNNASGDEFGDFGEVNNLFGNSGAGSNPFANTNSFSNGGGNILTNNSLASANAALPFDGNLASTAMENGTGTSAPSNFASAEPVALPTGTGVVKYIVSTTVMTDQTGTQTFGTLNQGDHPLVWDQGQYARMANGYFIPSSSLTDKAIGRPRNDARWRLSGQ